MENSYIFVSGKWQKRIVRVLIEAGVPLTYRHIAIRCGMVRDPRGIGALLRNTLRTLVLRQVVHRCEPGLFVLGDRQ